MKATPEEFALHQRMFAKTDPTALDDLASWLYLDLIRDLRSKENFSVPSEIIEECVGNAILDYCQTPEMYNPQRGTLRGFLLMVAQRDVHNTQARERRYQLRQVYHASVYSDDGRRDVIDESQNLERYVWTQELREQVLRAFSNATDCSIVKLMIDRVRDPEPYIELLKSELDGLPRSEQVKRVNRHKKRISWHLRRIGERFNE